MRYETVHYSLARQRHIDRSIKVPSGGCPNFEKLRQEKIYRIEDMTRVSRLHLNSRTCIIQLYICSQSCSCDIPCCSNSVQCYCSRKPISLYIIVLDITGWDYTFLSVQTYSMLNMFILKPPTPSTQCWACVMVNYQKLFRRWERGDEVCFVNVH